MLVHTNMRLKVMDIYVVANAPSVADFFNDIDGQYVVSTPGIISR